MKTCEVEAQVKYHSHCLVELQLPKNTTHTHNTHASFLFYPWLSRDHVSAALLVYLFHIVFIMPVELQPEIYRLIIKALVSQGKVLSETSADRGKCAQAASLPSTSIRREYQAYLARMMRVSKVSSTVSRYRYYTDM